MKDCGLAPVKQEGYVHNYLTGESFECRRKGGEGCDWWKDRRLGDTVWERFKGLLR